MNCPTQRTQPHHTKLCGWLGSLTGLENDPRQAVKDLAKKLSVNRTFLAGYLEALENQGYVKSK
jgi:DNA-binding IscR family transcriptional regulator